VVKDMICPTEVATRLHCGITTDKPYSVSYNEDVSVAMTPLTHSRTPAPHTNFLNIII